MSAISMAPEGASKDASGLAATRDLRRSRAVKKLRDYMAAEGIRGLAQKTKFARALGTTPGQLNQIVQGHRSISVWLAIKLDRMSSGALPMEEMHVETDDRHAIDWDHVRARYAKTSRRSRHDSVPTSSCST